MSWLSKLIATLRPEGLDTALDDELRFHIERRAEDFAAEGMAPEQARREAALLFGNRTMLQESTRERDVLIWLQTTLQDFRYSSRTLRRKPGFAAAAVLSLALGIGANTALFSLLDSLLLRMLPVAEPRRLVRVSEGDTDAFPYPVYDTLRSASGTLSSLAAMTKHYRDQRIEESGEDRLVAVQGVSGDYFDMLGVPARIGRIFHLSDAGSPEGNLAVVSDSYWRAHYGANPLALGAHFRRNNLDYIVCGVTPPGFQGMMLDAPVDIWIPVDPAGYAKGRGLQLIGRLRPGATPAQAAAEATALLHRTIRMQPGGSGISVLRGRFSKPLLVLEYVVVLVLLIACANLANLLLAGAASRAREFAVRQAIGAGRRRLVRQLLTESLLVSLIGAGLAIVVAQWLSRAILGFLPPDAAPAMANLSLHLDARVLGFTIGLALLTCLLFGLVPALGATRPSLTPGLKEAGSRRRVSGRWTSRSLVAGEVALSTLLLMGAGLFVRTLQNLKHLEAGFAPERVVVATAQPMRGYSQAQVATRMEALREQAALIPGVQVAAFSNIGLLSGFGINWRVDVEGYTPRPGEEPTEYELRISPGFFAAMGTPLLAGRDFTPRDDASSPCVAIVNESFARKFFQHDSPLGRRFRTNEQPPDPDIEIVGVVKDTKLVHLREEASAMFYRPYRQKYGGGVTLAVRASGGLNAVAAGIQRVAYNIDPHMTLKDAAPFGEIEDRTLVTERLVAAVSSAFGILALVVACIGLYGILAYDVARRTREIGVRMALGASPAGVRWMVLRESLRLVALGFAAGVPAALGASHYIASMLFGLTPVDPTTMVAALVVMLAVSFAAAYIPSRRAASIDPMEALRYE